MSRNTYYFSRPVYASFILILIHKYVCLCSIFTNKKKNRSNGLRCFWVLWYSNGLIKKYFLPLFFQNESLDRYDFPNPFTKLQFYSYTKNHIQISKKIDNKLARL